MNPANTQHCITVTCSVPITDLMIYSYNQPCDHIRQISGTSSPKFKTPVE